MIEAWFPTLIYYDFLSGIDNESLSKRAYQMYDESDSSVATKWECDTWNSLQYKPFKGDKTDDVINNLIKTTISHVEKYANEYDADLENYKVVCTDFWFNIAEYKDYQEFHQHHNNHFSAVYYVDVPPDSCNIVFKSIESIAAGITIPTVKRSQSIVSGSTHTCIYEPKPSLILIFKSNLLHMVEKNHSNDSRISIAMNFRLEPK